MSKELQSLNERIAERVGENLVDLIPDDQWQAIVDTEIEKFKRETAPKMIETMLAEAYKAKIMVILEKLTTQNLEWNNQTSEYISKELEKFISQSSGVIVAGMLSPSMQMVLQDLKNRLY